MKLPMQAIMAKQWSYHNCRSCGVLIAVGAGVREHRCKECNTKNTWSTDEDLGREQAASIRGNSRPLQQDSADDDRGGRDYGPQWPEQREKALERDGYECRLCGIGQGQCKEEHGCSLHVHHIVPYRLFDSDDEAHRVENLMAVCPTCHTDEEHREQSGAAEALAM